MSEIVAVDIGGTHARFAIARIEAGRVTALGEECTLRTGEYPGLQEAWEAFGARLGRKLPRAAGIAAAGTVRGDELQLTNHDWAIRPRALGLERFTLVNDFGAVAHAVAQLDPPDFGHLCGPDRELPGRGAISIVGPGTGLGVAQLLRGDGRYRVVETEGGHIGFAPLDPPEDRILTELRKRFGRVSAERIVSGPGLANLYEALAAIEGKPVRDYDDNALWRAALAGTDNLAAMALDRFFLSLGAIAGDIALAQGAQAVVIGGGLGLRLAERLPRSGFRDGFVAKGRFQARMEDMPVKLIAHQQPGLFGAAAAFAAEHGE